MAKGRSLVLLGVVLTIAFIWFLRLYDTFLKPNVKHTTILYLGATQPLVDLYAQFKMHKTLKNVNSFKRLARLKRLHQYIRPGRYMVLKNMNNRTVVAILRSGLQTPLKLTLCNIRQKEELAGFLGKQFEFDSIDVITLFNNREKLATWGITPETLPAYVIPNTYEMYWTISPDKFLSRMLKEYQTFWNASRLDKAKRLGLSPLEVAILASIVQEESNNQFEKEIIAGVYINRLKQGMRLQADPTVKYALGDVTVKRILLSDLSIDSPYNTYRYAGLPPGPINFPEISSINAVLNSRSHSFLFFCANPDFSGTHLFANTFAEHKANAQQYQKTLAEKGIVR